MNRKFQTSTNIQHMLLCICVAYVLIFQGLFSGLLNSEPLDKTGSNSLYDVICYSGQSTDKSADTTDSNKTHVKHKHCSLCQAANQFATLNASFVFDTVKYYSGNGLTQTVLLEKTHNRHLKSIYPPPIQSRGPPLQA